ncbi:MAG: hypothetical protein Q8P62_04785 [Candidatus Peregrinibacteria bacterium]|nr:hypothetical protein [Candidatus Peregrinibacteria bacterium]
MNDFHRPRNFRKRPSARPAAKRRPSVKAKPKHSPKKASALKNLKEARRKSEIHSALLNKLRKPRALKEKPKYFQLPHGVKLKILSQKDKASLRITETPDAIGPRLRRKKRFPNQKQMTDIRRNHEFWDPNNSGVPLIEINGKDLNKTVLVCGSNENPVEYKLKEFLRIDPKDINDAPPGSYFSENTGEYYRGMTRLNPRIIEKFGRLHKELEDLVNSFPAIPTKNFLTQFPNFASAVSRRLKKGQRRLSVRLFIDENYRTYGENIYTYFKRPTAERRSLPSYFSIHTSRGALDLQTFILVDGIKIKGAEAESLLRQAITAEWNKHGGGRGFYPKRRSFHIDARNKKTQWGTEW